MEVPVIKLIDDERQGLMKKGMLPKGDTDADR